MQRWFFLDNRKKKQFIPPKKMTTKEPEPQPEIVSQDWTFTVSAPEVGPRERVYISGSIPELGEWDYKRLVLLENQGGTDMWSITITIPNTCSVFYRYAVCIPIDDTNDVMVRYWETSIHPRVILESMVNPVTDILGEISNENKITKGWLTMQSILQFKFMKNPLKLKSRLSERLMNIKVTPVKLSFGTEHPVEDSLSVDTVDSESPPAVIVEVSTLNNDPKICSLKSQDQFGTEYKPNDILLVNVMTPNLQGLAYLVDVFSYSSRASSEDPPCHVGYTYVLPNMFKPSEGTLELPVTCNVKHRPLGTINIEYLIIHPMIEQLCDMQVSYAKHWDPTWTGLEVGHRGLGASFKNKEGNNIRENTVASLKKAAASGADLLEFDVQLSKDMIPVIYHDFHVCISMKRKKEVEFSEMLELPVKDLTLEQLQKLKVYHLVEGRNHEILFFDEDLEEHQPFPTLEDVMKKIDVHVGFNVELKWTMEMDDGTFELNNPFDMNTYVDKVLEVVLKHAGERRIVISCFNPDICTMVRHKQNKYPVMFLTLGITSRYQAYRDPRCQSIPAAVQSAVSSDILGVVVHTEDLLRDPTQVQLATNAGLVIFCWGDDNNDKNTIKRLKEMGLHAVIYDKLDQYTTKEVKESIFLVEARESQREIMRLAALEDLPATESSASAATPPESAARVFLDLSLRDRMRDHSTVTSLESLASSIDLRDDNNSDSNPLKRNRDIIGNVDKDYQVKEQKNSFRNLFPAGDNSKGSPKKSRKSD
ncbi:glycerophosphocholine phosphodiesterase GPCPD1-like isoform X1 [Plodia interpunctella]|uniref:glycerophosphocholine phosphodiesterase GPCPD1-like isoform X1 n=2 Tax=Plodia interpunctella TaxID=58824 RepID=UPI0023682179|nr:glycerophosphocholine phosphodiesterase GPCPD1-like isoform X1 [Plodia interpunctella]